MAFPLKFAFALTVLAFPLLELALLIKAGNALGFWPLLGIIVLTALGGAAVIRASGMSILSRIFSNLEAGGSGLEAMLDQFLTVTGGVLLVLPGLVGDTLGVLLLLSPVRAAVIKGISSQFVIHTWRSRSGPQTRTQARVERVEGDLRAGPTIIEGEYERIDDDEPHTPPRRPARKG